MNEAQERYDRVLAALNAEDEASDSSNEGDQDRYVTGGLSPSPERYFQVDLIQQYRNRGGSPFRGEFVKPGDR